MEILVMLLSTLATTTTIYAHTGKSVYKWLVIMDIGLVIASAIKMIKGKEDV